MKRGNANSIVPIIRTPYNSKEIRRIEIAKSVHGQMNKIFLYC